MTFKHLTTGIYVIGFAIVLALLFNVGFSLFMESPQYPTTACAPVSVGTNGVPVYDQTICDAANAQYQTQLEHYQFYKFIYSLIIGVLLLVGGLFISKSPLALGAMLAGVFQLIFGSALYWEHLNKWGRFGLLAMAALVLGYVGWKKLNDK